MCAEWFPLLYKNLTEWTRDGGRAQVGIEVRLSEQICLGRRSFPAKTALICEMDIVFVRVCAVLF